MLELLGTRQGFHRSLRKLPLDAPPLGPDLREPELGRTFPCDHDEIHSVRQERRPLPEALAAEPLHAVPAHCRTDLARDDEAQPGRRLRTSTRLEGDEEREMSRSDALGRLLRANELLVLSQPASRPQDEAQAAHYFL